MYKKKYLKYKTKYLALKNQLDNNTNIIQDGGGLFEWLGFYDEIDDKMADYYDEIDNKIDDKMADYDNNNLFIAFNDNLRKKKK
jgi:hypothetical protein